jgi:murein DD-endopeptidase MepM/ murein hydrolase activator NlpD
VKIYPRAKLILLNNEIESLCLKIACPSSQKGRVMVSGFVKRLSSAPRWVAALGFLTLGACATAPQSGIPTTDSYNDLSLCPGGGISNAPVARSDRQIAGYEPLTRVRGVVLARAPVAACLSSGFGPRRGGASGFHNGVDLYTRSPAPVFAGGDGVVEAVQTLRGYGKTIVIRHNGAVKTRYAHLSSYAGGLSPGDWVRRGDLIGRTGETGNATAVHLHYEILIGGRPRDPLSIGE